MGEFCFGQQMILKIRGRNEGSPARGYNDRMTELVRHAPVESAAPAGAAGGRSPARWRAHRLSDRFLLRVWLPDGRPGGGRAHRADPAAPTSTTTSRWSAAISSEIATYARVEDWAYRLLRAHTPGPYTFILPATREVPRRLQNPRRRTIGIRVPDHPVPRAILAELGEPIMSSTMLLPGDPAPITDADEIFDRLDGQVDLVIDGGNCGIEPTSVIDLTGAFPNVLRQGRGDTIEIRMSCQASSV